MIGRQSFSAIDRQINEMANKISQISSLSYETRRDEDGNLYLNFEGEKELKIPVIPFRNYQLEAQKALFVDGKKRVLLQRPRRSGKEVESWNFIVQGAIETPGLYIMVYPTNVRARKILWEGQIVMPDGSSFAFLDMIPKKLIFGKPNSVDMTIKLTNGSVIWIVGADLDIDKLRGINPRGVVHAEFAFSNPRSFYVIMPILRQNGGWWLGQSTFNGQNHFYRMIKDCASDPLWYVRSDSIVALKDNDGNRYITDEMIEEDRRAGMPEYLIQQEYYGNVQINQETRYFAKEINYLDENERIEEDLVLHNTPLYVAYDLGQNDCTAVTMFQMDYHFNPVIIYYFENNNKDFEFYLYETSKIAARLGLNIHTDFGPHDAVASKGPSTTNYVDYCRDHGRSMIVTRKPFSKIAVIQQMRKMLYRCKFNKENTRRLIDCLSNYEKEYDEKLQRYKDYPLHNWASHGVDSFQTMTLAIDDGLISSGYKPVIYI